MGQVNSTSQPSSSLTRRIDDGCYTTSSVDKDIIDQCWLTLVSKVIERFNFSIYFFLVKKTEEQRVERVGIDRGENREEKRNEHAHRDSRILYENIVSITSI